MDISVVTCLLSACSQLLSLQSLFAAHEVPKTQWRLGVSQLFLKPGQLACLEEARPKLVVPIRRIETISNRALSTFTT